MGFISHIFGGTPDTFQAQSAPITTQSALPVYLQQQYWQQQGLNGQEQGLANTLQNQANGAGPNPALAQLNQTTNQNNANSAALMGSQRGMNPGLIARQILMNNANQNQVEAGQGAIMQANQQLAAQQHLSSLYSGMGQQNLQGQNILQQALANENQAKLGNTSNINTTNANAAGANAQSNGGLFGGILGAGATLGAAALAASHGALVPGRASVRGDSPANDNVPAMLSPGEAVVPRTVMAKGGEAAKDFIEALKRHQKGSTQGEPQGYAKVLDAHRKLQERVKRLEAKS